MPVDQPVCEQSRKKKTGISVYSLLMLTVFFGIILSEGLEYLIPAAGKAGMILWGISFGFIFIFMLRSTGYLLAQVRRQKRVFTLLTLVILLAWTLIEAADPGRVWHETTQQIGCMLQHFTDSRDWGFHRTCFLVGYPARQFLIPTLPTFLMGRTPLAINLGGCIYFILGIVIFAASVQRNLSERFKNADLITAIVLVCFLHFYYVNVMLFHFEQALFPFEFALIACGLFLCIQSGDRTYEMIALAGFTGLYLIHVYPSGLAVYGLWAVVILNYMKYSGFTRKQKYLMLAVFLSTLASLAVSFQFRGDVRLFGKQPVDWLTFGKDLLLAARHVFYPVKVNPVMSPVVIPLIPLAIFAALSLAFGWEFMMVGLWCVATIFFAILAKGYTSYQVHFRLLRLTVILPVVSLMILHMARHVRFEFKRSFVLLLIIFLFLLGTGYHYNTDSAVLNPHGGRICHFAYWARKQLIDRYPETETLRLHFDPDVQRRFVPLNDHLRYFLPNSKMFVSLDMCSAIRYLKTFGGNRHFLVVSKPLETSCYRDIPLKYIGTFEHLNESAVMLYEIDQ
ncbi:hypothetical protein JXA40_02710 [bacterium]|nr:hypothetical protein [candidate division CSSED10-310 bacterium]